MALESFSNPFTPVFGNTPLIIAGRESLIGAVLEGLASAPGNPYRTTIFTGPRGSGKTVLLSHLSSLAEQDGWIGVHVAAEEGMLAELTSQTQEQAAEFLPKRAKSHITGIQAAGFGITRDIADEELLTWRTQMTHHLETLNKQGVGLLITVDEVKPTVKEFVSFVSTFQFFIRENRNVALLMAGLPHMVMQVFQNDSISFLRRAFRRKLEPIGLPEVRVAIKKTVELSGRTITREALDLAAKNTWGFPFLLQLIGFHIYNQSTRKTITNADALAGISDAQEDMQSMILETTLFDLTEREQQFLKAMLPDAETSSVADIAARLGVSVSNASHYKRRLIDRGILLETGRGKIRFAMPMLKPLLNEHLDHI